MLGSLGSQCLPVCVRDHQCLHLLGEGRLVDRAPVVIVLVVDQREAIHRHASWPDHLRHGRVAHSHRGHAAGQCLGDGQPEALRAVRDVQVGRVVEHDQRLAVDHRIGEQDPVTDGGVLGRRVRQEAALVEHLAMDHQSPTGVPLEHRRQRSQHAGVLLARHVAVGAQQPLARHAIDPVDLGQQVGP